MICSNEIRSSKKLSEEAEDKLASIVDDFRRVRHHRRQLGGSDAHVEAMDEADVEKESPSRSQARP